MNIQTNTQKLQFFYSFITLPFILRKIQKTTSLINYKSCGHKMRNLSSSSNKSKSLNLVQLEDNTFQSILLTTDHIQQVVKLVIDSFMISDPLWSKYSSLINNTILPLHIYKSNLGFGVILKPSNILIGVTTYYDLAKLKQIKLLYKQSIAKSNPLSDRLSSIFSQYTELENSLMLQQQSKKTKQIFLMYLGINAKFYEYKLGSLVNAIGLKRVFDIQYQRMCCIVYNPASTRLNLALGGKITAKRRNEQQNLDFNLFEFKSTQIQLTSQYVEINKNKSLKQMKRSNNLVESISASTNYIRSKL